MDKYIIDRVLEKKKNETEKSVQGKKDKNPLSITTKKKKIEEVKKNNRK